MKTRSPGCCLNTQLNQPEQLPGNPSAVQAVDGYPGIALPSNSIAPSSITSVRDQFSELLELIDSRNEKLVQRIENCLESTLLRHLDAFQNPLTSASGEPQKAAYTPNANQGNHNEIKAAAFPSSPVSNDKPSQISRAQTHKLNEASLMELGGPIPQLDHFEPGTVSLEIVEARGLHGADIGKRSLVGTSDPYVNVQIRKRRERGKPFEFKTHTVKKTVDPVWNASCKFGVAPDLLDIAIEIWDEDMFSKDDLLGKISVKPSDITSCEDGMERWFVLTPDHDCPHAEGEVLVRASYEPDEDKVGLNAYFGLQRWSADKVVDFEKPEEKGGMKKFVSSKKFDSVFCGLIVFNALVMVAELEYYGRKSMGIIGLDEPGSNYSPALESACYGLNICFAAAFLIELILRLTAFGREYLQKAANWLDIVIVVGAIVDVVADATGSAGFVNLTFLRLIRLTKLTRLLKAAMMAPFCEPLRILFNAMSTSFGYLFWSFVFLAMIEVVSAMLMTQVLADYIHDESLDLDLRVFIYTYYGTTSRSFLTMFQITMASGTWSAVGRPLIEKVNSAFAWFFIAYVGGVSFAVIRIIAALFLRKTLQTAVTDEESMKNEKVKDKRNASEDMRPHWNAPDATGKSSLAAFQRCLKTAQGHEWLEVLEISYSDACAIFDLMCDGYGRLTLDEFLVGVFRMTQPVKQVDVALLQQDAKQMGKMMDDLHVQLHEVQLLCQKRS